MTDVKNLNYAQCGSRRAQTLPNKSGPSLTKPSSKPQASKPGEEWNPGAKPAPAGGAEVDLA